ncbi:hypothetical protein WA026_005753 [Henosepilachna vigintioctopunctata]|uniref:Uncharacterized protein n=1 Tax=Henosepilachna vigintioctopunctata TaxID=420089 RepID=A0AAW1U4W1_9CUCU
MFVFYFCIFLGTVNAQLSVYDYLQRTEEEIVHLKHVSAGCRPLLDWTIIKLYQLSQILFGYDEHLINMEFRRVVNYFRVIKLHLPPNARMCVDTNYHIAEIATKTFKYDSRCFIELNVEIIAILHNIFVTFLPPHHDVTLDCHLPLFCGLLRMNIAGLMVSLKTLFSLMKDGVKLIYHLVTFVKRLRICRTNIHAYKFILNNIVSNANMCKWIASK